MPFYIMVPSLITPVHCITQTEEPMLLGLGVTQLYGYVRYGLFPINPKYLITGLPDNFFLEKKLISFFKSDDRLS